MDYGLAARRKQHSLETQLQDCHRALRWLHSGLRGKLVALHPALRAAAAAPLVVTVGGESAGGHLSLTLALTERDSDRWVADHRWLAAEGGAPEGSAAGAPPATPGIAGVLDLFGAHDLADEDDEDAERDGGIFKQYIRHLVVQRSFRTHRRVFEQLSPLHLARHEGAAVGAHMPPVLGVHGTHDTLIAIEEARTFYGALRAARDTAAAAGSATPRLGDAFVEVEGAPHAFNFLSSPWAYALSDAAIAYLTAACEEAETRLELEGGIGSKL